MAIPETMAISTDLHAFQRLAREIHNTFNSAAKREAAIDQRMTAEKIADLEAFVDRLEVVWVLGFLEQTVGDEVWTLIKSSGGRKEAESLLEKYKKANPGRSRYPEALPEHKPGASWDLFDAFKYARDCFAHRANGNTFPLDDKNTQRFVEFVKQGDGRDLATLDGGTVTWRPMFWRVFSFVEGFVAQIAAWLHEDGNTLLAFKASLAEERKKKREKEIATLLRKVATLESENRTLREKVANLK